MSEMSFEQMLNDSFKTIKNGDVVEGTVISVKPDEIVLNIGYKSDGIITRREYTNDDNLDLTTVVKEGDPLEAIVTKVNDGEGQVNLSYKRLAQVKGNEKLEKAYENQEVITAEVTQILNGGLGVLVDETRVFIPASLVSDTFVRDLNQYKGQEISFVITEFNPRKRRIIGDRKQLLVAEKTQKMEELLSTLKVGDVIEGKVKNLTDFGAFIDLGGVDGLLHISEISWTRIENPKKVFNVGDVVKVFVKEINGNKIAHGGLIYSLADDAMGTAALSTGRNVCTVNAQIDYLRPGIGKKLIAEAESVKVGKTLGVYKCKIYNDEDKLVATATGTYYFLDA